MTYRDEAYEQGSLSPERCERLLNRAPRRAWTPPRQRQIGNPPDVAHCHVRGLRTAKFSGRGWDRTSDLPRVNDEGSALRGTGGDG
jgi:hypothetical protein